MSIVSGFTNQKAMLQTYAGRDGFGKATYNSPRTIRVRKEPAQGVRISATGTDVAVETSYLTEETVTTQDRIDGVNVRRVADIIGMGGERLGCEVWT